MSSEFIAHDLKNTDLSSPARFVWSHVRRHPGYAFLMIFGAFSNALLASVVPIFTGWAVDSIIEDRNLTYVAWMTVAIISSQLVRGALQFMRNFSSETFAQRIERDVRDELYVSLLAKSMSFHDRQPVGEIMARVTNDVREVNLMMNPGFNLIIGSGMFILLPLLAAPTIHPALILSPLAFVASYAVVQVFYVRALHRVAQEVRSSFGRMNARLAETLDGIEVVKGTAQEDQEVRRFNRLVEQVRDWFVAQGDIEARYVAILLMGLATVGGFLHSIYLYQAGAIAAGDIIAFMGQLSLFGFPVFTSIFSFSRVASGLASAERILNIITAQTDLDQNENGYDARLNGAIEFEDVDFGYLPGRQVLHGVSFAVQPGQTVEFFKSGKNARCICGNSCSQRAVFVRGRAKQLLLDHLGIALHRGDGRAQFVEELANTVCLLCLCATGRCSRIRYAAEATEIADEMAFLAEARLGIHDPFSGNGGGTNQAYICAGDWLPASECTSKADAACLFVIPCIVDEKAGADHHCRNVADGPADAPCRISCETEAVDGPDRPFGHFAKRQAG